MEDESEPITMDDYRRLAEIRYQLRRFLRLSEEAARANGLEPQQHQLLLAIKGLPADQLATIGNLAARLQLQHHSTVELIDRLEERDLVTRSRRKEDRRQVLIRLTPQAETILRDLSILHRRELRTVGPRLILALNAIMPAASSQAVEQYEGEREA